MTSSPVSLKISHASIVPNTARGSRNPSTFCSSHSIFVPEKYGIEHQPRPLAHQRLVTLFAQLGAASRGPAVLPHDRAVKRLARLAVPDAHGLALVGDPDRLQFPRLDAGVVERLTRHRVRHLPDLGGIVLDPARAREVLLELPVAAPDQLRLLVEHEAGRAGRALVDCEDHGGNLSGGGGRGSRHRRGHRQMGPISNRGPAS